MLLLNIIIIFNEWSYEIMCIEILIFLLKFYIWNLDIDQSANTKT